MKNPEKFDGFKSYYVTVWIKSGPRSVKVSSTKYGRSKKEARAESKRLLKKYPGSWTTITKLIEVWR